MLLLLQFASDSLRRTPFPQALPCVTWISITDIDVTLSFLQGPTFHWKVRKKQVNDSTDILNWHIKYDFLKTPKTQSLLQHFPKVFNLLPSSWLALLWYSLVNYIWSPSPFIVRKSLDITSSYYNSRPVGARFRESTLNSSQQCWPTFLVSC